MSHPLITVLMTVYNGGAYLPAAVQSVLSQTHPDFEFLIVNDCSSDNSAEIIKSFADPRVRLINNEKNLGQTRSLNKGLSLARGRYIARIDADDLAFPRWLEENLALIQDQSETAVVSCRAVVIDSLSQPQKVLNTPMTYDEMILRCLTASPINHVGSLFKTDVITSVGGYNEYLKVVADYGLWSTLIQKQIRFAVNPEVLVAVRVHEKSVSMVERGRKDIWEMCKVMAGNLKALTNVDLDEDQVRALWRLYYSPENMSDSEFRETMDLFSKIYNHLRPEFRPADELLNAYVRDRKRTFYAKKALGDMAGGRGGSLRSLSYHYSRSHGVLNVFSLLWLGSWLGSPVLKKLPTVYKQWTVRSTKEILEKRINEELLRERA